jgi:hypothetical protein
MSMAISQFCKIHSNMYSSVLTSSNFRTSIVHDFVYEKVPQKQIRIEEVFN